MVIDIGGGTTEIAVLTLCGVVAMSSIKVGGDTFDAAIAARLRNEFFGIGPLTAERLKIERGYAGRPPGQDPYTVAGSDLRNRRPGKREIDETLVAEAMRDGIDRIARAAWSILEATPPDLAGELMEAGIVLTGGSAKMEGAIELAEEVFHVPVRLGMPQQVQGLSDVVRNPIYSTGMGLLLYARDNVLPGGKGRGLSSAKGALERMRSWFQGNF